MARSLTSDTLCLFGKPGLRSLVSSSSFSLCVSPDGTTTTIYNSNTNGTTDFVQHPNSIKNGIEQGCADRGCQY